MKTELLSELFDSTLFPVFATGTAGTVLYKNPAAGKYLPMIRRSASVRRHLRNPQILLTGGITEIIGDTPYRRVLVTTDDGISVFLALSRLQYQDGEKIAEEIITEYGTGLIDFLAAVKNADDALYRIEQPNDAFAKGRVYTDLLSLFDRELTGLETGIYDICALADRLFEKLKGAFRALGYRITVGIRDEVRENRLARLNPSDFLFLFQRLLYLQMKLSDNGIIGIELFRDEEQNAHVFAISTRTSLSGCRLCGKSVAPFFDGLAPECVTEFALFEKLDAFEKNTELAVDAYGRAVIQYRVPYLTGTQTLSLHSIDFNNAALDNEIDRMIRAIRRRLSAN